MAELHERVYELARDALTEQERSVADMRTRGGPIAAATGVVAGLLAGSVFADSAPDGLLAWALTAVGAAGAIVVLAATVWIFRPTRFSWTLHAPTVYEELRNSGHTTPPEVDILIAYRLQAFRDTNVSAVDEIRTALRASLIGLGLLVVCWSVAAALT